MKQVVRRKIGPVLVAVTLTFLPLLDAAMAQSAAAPSDWGFQITPYLWLVGIGGNVSTPRGLSASFSQSIGDVLGNLDGGLMLLGDVNYRRWQILADFDYARLTTNSSGALLGQSSLTTTEYLGTLDAGYRLVDSDTLKLDGFVGVRVMSIGNDLSVGGGGLLPPLSASAGDTWADPLLATRAILQIGGGFFGNAYADIGGGPSGDLTWQLYGGVGYSFDQTFAAFVGYRYLAINRNVNNFKFDISQQGPLIGLRVRF